MQGIKAYMKQNPGRLAEVLGQNPSYVFFRELTGSSEAGPVGALGTPLLGEYAGAIDRHYITLGAPLFVATAHPTTKKPSTASSWRKTQAAPSKAPSAWTTSGATATKQAKLPAK